MPTVLSISASKPKIVFDIYLPYYDYTILTARLCASQSLKAYMSFLFNNCSKKIYFLFWNSNYFENRQRLQFTMKGKEIKSHHVPTDEPYVENLNLVTGDKFNYDKPLITEREIKQLCIDDSMTPLGKFMLILKDGDKIQKWSIFQNFSSYVANQKEVQKVLQQIYKNYADLNEFLAILGEGLSNYLQKSPKYLNKECIDLIFELTYRTVTQNPSQVDDWGTVLQRIAKYPYFNVEKCVDYVNGSFSMNSPPERRRVAFCMIRHLMEYSQEIRKIASTKVLFFNKDQNHKTRAEICHVMKSIIESNTKDEEVWKAIWEYFHDKDSNVRQIAANIICNILYEPNFQLLVEALSSEGMEAETCKFIGTFVMTFCAQVQEGQRARSQIFSFFNRVFKSKKTQNIVTLISSLTLGVIKVLGQGQIYQDLNFSVLPLKNKQVMEQLINLYHLIEDPQFRQGLQALIFKNLKETQYEYYGKCDKLVKMFDLAQQEQISIYLSMCAKMLEASKWHQLRSLLKEFRKIIFAQTMYERACIFMLRLWMACPAFLMEEVIDKVIYLVVINKKSFQFLITIRQKILNAKFWSHRKNYIIFYSILRGTTSFDCHKFIPVLVYKNIVSDKSLGVRMTLLNFAPQIYKFTDPQCSTEKAMIKQAISKLEEDKDIEIRLKAEAAKLEIAKIDKNNGWLAEIYDRNRLLAEKQISLVQVTNEPKRAIKTQNQIAKSTAKSKRKFANQHRKTVNVGKIEMHKDISIDSITMAAQQGQKPTTGLLPKKNNLFRCHSVKIKVPNKKA